MDNGDQRCQWEQRSLGRDGTWGKTLGCLSLILLGTWGMYSVIDRTRMHRAGSPMDLGMVLDAVAVPEPLFQEARKGNSPVFADLKAYQSFLEENGLEHAVIVERVRNDYGMILYHRFHALREGDTFSGTIAHLQELVSGHVVTIGGFRHTRVYTSPAQQLSSRSEAETALERGSLFCLEPERAPDRFPVSQSDANPERP
jgi:hypothetical protein